MSSLENKVILVTGASSGIGQQIALSAASEGAQLVLVARRHHELIRLAKILTEHYATNVLVVTADLTDSVQIERTVAKTMSYFGRIDVLINAAGFGEFKPAVDFTYQEIEGMFQLNTYAMMYLAQLVSLEMMKCQSGHIFFLASVAGKLATPSSGVYSATKSAIISYANALRLELKRHHIHVTTVNPGPVATPFFHRTSSLSNYYQRIQRFTLRSEQVAESVLDAIGKPKREITQPWLLKWGARLNNFAPTIGDYLILNVFNYKEGQ